MNKIIVTLLLLATLSIAAFADISISASVDRNVIGVDEQVVLEVQLSGNASHLPDPKIPAIPNFTAYSSGRSQSISIVNGSMSSAISYRYVLAPRTTGKSTIPPITLQHEGKTYQTQPISIEVVAGNAPHAAASPQGSAPAPSPEAGKNLFITASLDRSSGYVNEQLVYTFRFYRKVRLLSNPQYVPPNFSGFWTEELPPKNFYATVNGQKYVVTEVKTLLFPTTPGNYRLGNATLQCNIEDFNRSDPFSDDFFSSFFSGGKTQVLQTDPLAVSVLALPQVGKPAGFSGTVGRYRIAAQLDKTSAKVNEPVTLSVTISGAGSIKTIAEPHLPDWPDFRKLETANSMDINKNEGALKGSKTFKTVLIPLIPGKKTIPPPGLFLF